MSMQNFFRGPRSKYVEADHGEGIFFATDTNVILMGGKEYIGPLANSTAVANITLGDDGSSFIISYLNGETDTIEIVVSKVEYVSNIQDKELAMPNAVGGLAKGTKISSLEGKTYNEMFDDILFPTVNPTFTIPSATITLKNYTSPVEVGSIAPTIDNFTVTYNAGSITLNGVKQANRGGAHDVENSYIYYVYNDSSDDNRTLPTTVALGNTSYVYVAEYGEGPQPKNNKGGDYSIPYPAGRVGSPALNVNGTYPWFASTESTGVVKQSLIAWNSTAGSMSTGNFALQPSGTTPQVFKLPRQLSTLQMLNTVSNQMETIATTEYTETTEIIDINGDDVTYHVYTYNGSTRGSVTLLAKF